MAGQRPPNGVTPPARLKNGNPVLNVALEGLSPPWVSVMERKIVLLPEEKVFLGLAVNPFKATGNPKSGWWINEPGDWTTEKTGHVCGWRRTPPTERQCTGQDKALWIA